jgi:outer membrane protein assembly factor BamD
MAGESYFKQRNSPDRDQTATKDALAEYQRLLELYPASSFIEQARQRIVECRQTLARSEHMVGFFYQKTRKAYRAAASRYEGIVKNYPDYAAFDEVLFRLAEVLIFSARAPEAAPYLGRLFEEFPDSKYAPEARELFEQIRAATPAPAAPAASEPQPTPELP